MTKNRLFIVLSIATLILVFGLYLFPDGKRNDASPSVTGASHGDESEQIVEMFQKGLRINATNNPDLAGADAYGAALTQIALERLVECPTAAPRIKAAFASHIAASPPMVRYTQWGIFLDFLERSLNHCRDSENLRIVWQVRSNVGDERNRIALEIAKEAETLLDAYIGNLKTPGNTDSSLSPTAPSLTPDENLSDMLDFLFDEMDTTDNTDEKIKGEIAKIRNKAAEIVQYFDKTRESEVVRLEQCLETEKRKDISPDGTDAFVPERNKDKEGEWKTGPYQQLMEATLALNGSLENSPSSYWNKYLDTETADAVQDVRPRLAKVFEETRRMQAIRYNLWATRRLSNNATLDTITSIDAGLLTSAVVGLYQEKESELLKKNDDPTQRTFQVRKLLLTVKAGLNAF